LAEGLGAYGIYQSDLQQALSDSFCTMWQSLLNDVLQGTRDSGESDSDSKVEDSVDKEERIDDDLEDDKFMTAFD